MIHTTQAAVNIFLRHKPAQHSTFSPSSFSSKMQDLRKP